ncbi:FkbM family methyltransferase [Rhizobium sp. TH2]|uniref:FkbM family methyltransferase n=1 Tax=Rhizobium sp. TH2 TaxID=2775403 RepID=UPI0021576848|nr:FkbM family methyltransferase [Rhizobium sp. TH2]UVC07549.1 FkbM family methyltransferase [Rhizobium sp. TH2]
MAQLAASKDSIGTGRYRARHFAAPPSTAEALRLLDEIAASRTDFPTLPTNLPLALYGAGNLGQMAKEFLAEVGRDFDFVIDRNADTLGEHPLWRDKPIYAPDAAPAHLMQSHLVLVTVVTAPYVPLEAMLDDLGFAHIAPFYDFAENFRAVHSLSNGWYAPPLSDADHRNAASVLSGFADDASRAHHLQFLAWRQLRQEWLFDGTVVANHNRFSIPEVLDALEADPVFLDGGAHHGSVSLALDRLRPDWREIIAVEPDSANRTVLEKTFNDHWPDERRTRIIGDALGTETGKARFHSGLGYASQISPIGQDTVTVTMLDALDLEPTFVKLHLEGGELDALKGGLETFHRSRPIIAATVYHNADGIWKTPLWLMENLADCRILFRTHSWCGTGAVAYAIPNEKINM